MATENKTEERKPRPASGGPGGGHQGGHQGGSGPHHRGQGPQHKKRLFYYRKKVCKICSNDLETVIDYKNVDLLRKFVTEKGKIIPRRLSGTCAKHQRILTRAIKQARTIAFLPYTEI